MVVHSPSGELRASYFAQIYLMLREPTVDDKEMATATQKEFHTTIERGEDGYFIASVVESPGCHTQAKSMKELDKRLTVVPI